jgi:hypothetical protein
MEITIFRLPSNVWLASWPWLNDGKNILLFILSNIMNNLDVAICHLMDDCLVATCQIKVGAW